jgi:hypothetical protein
LLIHPAAAPVICRMGEGPPMPLDELPRRIPTIVPDNNLRLPDALTVEYGPAPLLSEFVLQGDRAVREMGIRLRLRYDFDELLYINKEEVARGTWFPLVNMFDPQYTTLTPENSYWLSGENENGEVILTWAARVYYWNDSTLKDNIGLFLCDKGDRPRSCVLTPEAARELRVISGGVFWGGSLWIHPDYRLRRLSPLVGRLGRAFAVSRWPVDWIMCLVQPTIVEKGIAAGYGYRHMIPGILFPKSVYGDLNLFLVYLSSDEAYADFSEFFAAELSDSASDSAPSSQRRLLQTVTSISSPEVVHGSRRRSYRDR